MLLLLEAVLRMPCTDVACGCQIVLDGNTRFEGNRADDRGGMIHGYRDVDLLVQGHAELRANWAKNAGGAIAIEGAHHAVAWDWRKVGESTIEVRGQASVLANAALAGGGLWTLRHVTLHVGENARVQDNVAETSGGGIAGSQLRYCLCYSATCQRTLLVLTLRMPLPGA